MPAVRLLRKVGLMQSERLLIFLLNCLKSSWVLVRIHAYDLLTKFPDDHPQLSDPGFVEMLVQTGLDFSQSPKAMISEGSALLLKLVFSKCLKSSKYESPLAFLNFILQTLETRLKTF